VIQEWWGLDDHMIEIVDRFAAEGFVALAPDLFGGRVAHDADEAGELMSQLPAEEAATDLGGAVDYLLGASPVSSKTVGAVGFCMGGGSYSRSPPSWAIECRRLSPSTELDRASRKLQLSHGRDSGSLW